MMDRRGVRMGMHGMARWLAALTALLAGPTVASAQQLPEFTLVGEITLGEAALGLADLPVDSPVTMLSVAGEIYSGKLFASARVELFAGADEGTSPMQLTVHVGYSDVPRADFFHIDQKWFPYLGWYHVRDAYVDRDTLTLGSIGGPSIGAVYMKNQGRFGSLYADWELIYFVKDAPEIPVGVHIGVGMFFKLFGLSVHGRVDDIVGFEGLLAVGARLGI
jgi:hypothetical protein